MKSKKTFKSKHNRRSYIWYYGSLFPLQPSGPLVTHTCCITSFQFKKKKLNPLRLAAKLSKRLFVEVGGTNGAVWFHCCHNALFGRQQCRAALPAVPRLNDSLRTTLQGDVATDLEAQSIRQIKFKWWVWLWALQLVCHDCTHNRSYSTEN